MRRTAYGRRCFSSAAKIRGRRAGRRRKAPKWEGVKFSGEIGVATEKTGLCAWPWLSPCRYCACSAACIGFLLGVCVPQLRAARSAGGYREIAHPALSCEGAEKSLCAPRLNCARSAAHFARGRNSFAMEKNSALRGSAAHMSAWQE